MALHLKAKLWSKHVPRWMPDLHSSDSSLPVFLAGHTTTMARLTADGLNDLIPEELRTSFFFCWVRMKHPCKGHQEGERPAGSFHGMAEIDVLCEDDVRKRRGGSEVQSTLKYPTAGSGKGQHQSLGKQCGVATWRRPTGVVSRLTAMMHLSGKRPSMVSVCAGLPQEVSPASRLSL